MFTQPTTLQQYQSSMAKNKKKKNKHKRNYLNEWDNAMFGGSYNRYFETSDSKDINKIAIEVFGSLYYNP